MRIPLFIFIIVSVIYSYYRKKFLVLVPFIIALSGKRLLHPSIEFLCRIIAHLFLTMVNSCRFADHRKISSRSNRNVVADHLIAKIFCILLLKTKPVIFFLFIPVLQADDKIYALCVFDTGYTEQSLNIYNANTAKLNKVFGDIRC